MLNCYSKVSAISPGSSSDPLLLLAILLLEPKPAFQLSEGLASTPRRDALKRATASKLHQGLERDRTQVLSDQCELPELGWVGDSALMKSQIKAERQDIKSKQRTSFKCMLFASEERKTIYQSSSSLGWGN